MANNFRAGTNLWEVTETGTLITEVPNFTNPIVRKVVLKPNATADSVTFQGGPDTENAIYLESGGSDTSNTQIDFGERGRRIPGLKCSAISASATAYVYLL